MGGLAASRQESLSRLLISLASNDFGCSGVDLLILVDYPQAGSEIGYRRCVDTAAKFHWSHGKKTVQRRLRHAGLSLSWFEIPYLSEGYEYVAIFEDDMEASPSFFSIFSVLMRKKALRTRRLQPFACTLTTGKLACQGLVGTRRILKFYTKVLNLVIGALFGNMR